jgi:hypothetical protein
MPARAMPTHRKGVNYVRKSNLIRLAVALAALASALTAAGLGGDLVYPP